MSTATIFGSFPSPVAQRATVSTASTGVAPMFDSFARDNAPQAEPLNESQRTDNAATASIFGSYSNHLAVVPAAEPSPVGAFGAWLARMQQARADARLWEIARSDSRVMDELMQAQMRDDSDTLAEPVAALARPAAPVRDTAPAERQPHQRAAGRGWGRIIEDAYQHRFTQPRRPQPV